MYQEFAHMYDEMMDEIPYEKWFECVRDYLEVQGYEKDSKVCELGCGTGTLTRMFHQAGYDIMGVDLSEEMLMEAREKVLVVFIILLVVVPVFGCIRPKIAHETSEQ